MSLNIDVFVFPIRPYTAPDQLRPGRKPVGAVVIDAHFRSYRRHPHRRAAPFNKGGRDRAVGRDVQREHHRRPHQSKGDRRGAARLRFTVQVEVLQQRGADTVSAGFSWRLTAMSSLSAAVEHQRRDDSSHLTIGSLSVIRRF